MLNDDDELLCMCCSEINEISRSCYCLRVIYYTKRFVRRKHELYFVIGPGVKGLNR